MSSPDVLPFWQTKTLDAMTDSEWESLCDGCGLCCLHKFEDEDTGEVEFTCVGCQYLSASRSCQVYSDRTERVDGCLNVRTLSRDQYNWLPDTCAYRRIDAGLPLPLWHPLRTGSSEAMEAGGYCVGDWMLSDAEVDVDTDFIVRLPVSRS